MLLFNRGGHNCRGQRQIRGASVHRGHERWRQNHSVLVPNLHWRGRRLLLGSFQERGEVLLRQFVSTWRVHWWVLGEGGCRQILSSNALICFVDEESCNILECSWYSVMSVVFDFRACESFRVVVGKRSRAPPMFDGTHSYLEPLIHVISSRSGTFNCWCDCTVLSLAGNQCPFSVGQI